MAKLLKGKAKTEHDSVTCLSLWLVVDALCLLHYHQHFSG